jgi:hypothetical protein
LGAVNCGRVFTWGFDLDELAQVLEEPRKLLGGGGEKVSGIDRYVIDKH